MTHKLSFILRGTGWAQLMHLAPTHALTHARTTHPLTPTHTDSLSLSLSLSLFRLLLISRALLTYITRVFRHPATPSLLCLGRLTINRLFSLVVAFSVLRPCHAVPLCLASTARAFSSHSRRQRRSSRLSSDCSTARSIVTSASLKVTPSMFRRNGTLMKSFRSKKIESNESCRTFSRFMFDNG